MITDMTTTSKRSGPVTRAQALRSGLSLADLTGAQFRRAFHGVYVPSAIPLDDRERARAALLIAPPGSYASHHTAAALWRVWSPDTASTHLTVPSGVRSVRRGIAAHRDRFGTNPRMVRGVPASPPGQIFLELAADGVDLVDLIAVGDSLVRRKYVTESDLVRAAVEWTGPNCRRSRRAAAFVRPGVDSSTETRLRMLLVLGGLPEPVVNLIIRRSDGSWERRLDHSYPDRMLVVEYDGRHHALDPKQWAADLARREELERRGWRFIVVTAEMLYGDPMGVLIRVREALRDRGLRLPRRTPSVEWHRLFVRR